VTSEAGIIGLTPQPGIEANVEGPGSVWSNLGDLTVFFGSLLRIADGAVVIAQLVDVFLDAELEADGTILGDLQSSGTIRVGDPIGNLDVQGTFTNWGELLLDLEGPVPGGFDAVAVSGEAFLDGVLGVSLVGGFMPQPGDRFQILTAESVSGTFGTVNLPSLPPNVVWHVGYNVDSVELLVTTIGDLDGDGVVGIIDFLALLGAWGPCPAPPVPCPADLDGDGMVGIVDMLLLLSLWS